MTFCRDNVIGYLEVQTLYRYTHKELNTYFFIDTKPGLQFCRDKSKAATHQSCESGLELSGSIPHPKDFKQILLSYQETRNILKDKNLMMKLVINTKVIILEKKPSILEELDDHCQEEMESHRLLLLQKICELFFSLRLKHVGSTYKTNVHHVRHILSKLILFRNN